VKDKFTSEIAQIGLHVGDEGLFLFADPFKRPS
jgi:hypothetical protein